MNRIVLVLACIAFAMSGCGTVGASPPSTQYKGDARWNISQASAAERARA